MVVVEKLLTAEEFWERYADERYELVRGEAVERMTPSSRHSDIAAFIVEFLAPYVREHDLGRVKVEAHYQLGERTMRVPDVSFLSHERQAQIPDVNKFIPFAPELAIEIISPSETHAAVRDKINDYRAAGTAMMWLVYPDTKSVDVYDLPGGRIVRFGPEDTLRLEAVLPGFELPLRQIFGE